MRWPIHVSTYGAFAAAGYLVGILWLKSQIAFMPKMNEEKFWLMIYGLFFGAIMGGKLLFVALEWPSFASGELMFLRDFRYGFVFFGGLLGSALMGFLVSWSLKAPYIPIADFFGVAVPLGHALGRLGCLGAGCCYGRPTNLPWGIVLGGSPASSTPEELWGVPLHPTQIYESSANLAIAAFLARRVLPLVKQGRLPPGTVFFGYVLLYSVARFAIECFRGDDRGGMWLGLSISQWIAIGGILASAGMMARARPKLRLVVGL